MVWLFINIIIGYIDRKYCIFMNLFKRKPETITSLVCKICEMEFSDPERTMRHMIKAHSKPQKTKK
jgi:hypothetical protein